MVAAIPLQEAGTLGTELLNASVTSIPHIDVAACIHGHALWTLKLAEAPSQGAKLLEIDAPSRVNF